MNLNSILADLDLILHDQQHSNNSNYNSTKSHSVKSSSSSHEGQTGGVDAAYNNPPLTSSAQIVQDFLSLQDRTSPLLKTAIRSIQEQVPALQQQLARISERLETEQRQRDGLLGSDVSSSLL